MNNRDLLDIANDLRKNGGYEHADKIYNQLMIDFPENDEIVFCKALNVMEKEPELAIDLFAKAYEINPELIVAIKNISAVAENNNKCLHAIIAFNSLLKKHPGNLDIVYYKAKQLENSGDILNAIINYYYSVDNSYLNSNPEAFINHQISRDIGRCKIELRNELLLIPTPQIRDETRIRKVQIKQYEYPLPAKLFGDENIFLEFGEMMGKTIKEIIQINPNYIKWCILNLDNFCVARDILKILENKGINVKDCEDVNIFKLKLADYQRPKIKLFEEPPDQFLVDRDGNINF